MLWCCEGGCGLVRCVVFDWLRGRVGEASARGSAGWGREVTYFMVFFEREVCAIEWVVEALPLGIYVGRIGLLLWWWWKGVLFVGVV